MFKYFFKLILLFLLVTRASAQTTYTVQPDATAGVDALVHSLTANQNTNYGTLVKFSAMRWTSGGVPFSTRMYLQFDLSSIPSTAKICSATLTMYTQSENYQSGSNRTNAAYLKRNTTSWSEGSITWNNQPSSFSESDKISTPSFTTTTVGSSFTVDVSTHIQTMVSDPSNNFGWVGMLQDETNTYTSLGMSTSDYSVSVNRPMLSVTYFDASVSTSNAWRCTGSSANLTTTVTPAGTYTYSWSPASTLNVSNTASVVATPTATTNYSVTITTSGGCSLTRTVSVNVVNTPTITTNNPSACLGSSASLTPTVSAGASPTLTYSWTPSTYLSSTTTATVTSTPTVTGTFTYNVNVTNNTFFINCSQNAISTVTINAYPTLTITPSSATICSGSGTTLTATGASTYSWSPSTGLSATTGSVVTASPTVTTTYTLNGTTAGCTSTKTVQVTVNSLPTLTVTPSSATICSGASTTLTATGANTYTWSPTTALSCSICAAPTASPTTTITYTVTGTNTVTSCVNTKTVTVTVNSLPTLTVTPSAPGICTGSNTTLTATGADTYTWSPNTALSCSVCAAPTASPTTTITYTVTGTNTVTSCVNTKTVTVTVNSLPTLTVTPSAPSICTGSSTTLTATGANTYTWSPTTALSCSVCAAPAASPTTTITYTVTGTNTVTSCVNTKTVTVTVNPLPTLTVTPSAPSICTGSNTTLTATGADTYTWSPNTALSCSVCAAPTASPTTTITYTVTGTNTVTSCVNTKTVTVTINSLPTLTVTPSSTTICSGTSTTLTATGANTYTWSPTTALSCSVCAAPTASPTTTITYTVIGTNTVTSCVNTKTVTVTVNPTPTVTVTSDTIYGSISSVTLTASGGTTYSWTPATGLSATTGSSVVASPTVTTIYTVTGTSSGCSSTATSTVTNLNLYYRSKQTGNWFELSTWESSPDNSTWSNASILPNYKSLTITIQATHTVSITTSVSIDQTVANGTLKYADFTGNILTIKNGTGPDLTVNGVFSDVGPNDIVWSASSTWTMGSAGILYRTRATSSDNWRDAYDGGISTIPATGNWVIRKTGTDNPTLSSTGGMYYPNLIIDNTSGSTWTMSGSSNFTGSSDFPRIKGSLTIGGVGSGNYVNFTNGNTNPSPVLVQGDILVKDGSTLQNNGTGIELQGNISGAGTLTYSNTPKLVFSGGSAQTFSISGTVSVYTLQMNKSANALTLAYPLSLDNSLILTSGNIVTTSTNLLTLKNGATVSGGGFTSFVSGPIQKIGNSTFTFPTGKGNNYLPISISAPANTTDAFVAEYFNSMQSYGSTKDSIIDTLSYCEYWNLNQSVGTSTVSLTIGWDSLSCMQDSSQYMRGAYWDGTSWRNLTVTGNSGSARNGSISLTPYNPLGGIFGGGIIIWHPNKCLFIPPPTANAGTSQIYSGTPVMIGGSPTGSGLFTPLSFSWSPSTGINTPYTIYDQNPYVSSISSTIIYTVEVKDTRGCKSTSTVSVLVIEPVYAVFKKKLDGGFYVTTAGHLFFKMEEKYRDGNFDFKVYSTNLGSSVPALLPVTGANFTPGFKNYGTNWFDLNLNGVSGIVNNQYYILETSNDKGQKEYIRFQYK
ncbi:MAG: DNRLRE domain-containing protein [Bacteroidia bacterium]